MDQFYERQKRDFPFVYGHWLSKPRASSIPGCANVGVTLMGVELL